MSYSDIDYRRLVIAQKGDQWDSLTKQLFCFERSDLHLILQLYPRLASNSAIYGEHLGQFPAGCQNLL
jgi:hypothetical protein